MPNQPTADLPRTEAPSKQRWVRLGLISAVVLIPLVLFAVLVAGVRKHTPGFDTSILKSIHRHTSSHATTFFRAVTEAGSALGVGLLVLLGAGLLWLRKHKQQALYLVASLVGAAALNVVVKALIHRARPELWHHLVVEQGYSFPSGHAMASSALAFSIIGITWSTKWRWPSLVVALLYMSLVGLSRLYLGVHYPTDVISGWCLSLVWVTAAWYAIRQFGFRKAHTS